jgi:hypothetical protein
MYVPPLDSPGKYNISMTICLLLLRLWKMDNYVMMHQREKKANENSFYSKKNRKYRYIYI